MSKKIFYENDIGTNSIDISLPEMVSDMKIISKIKVNLSDVSVRLRSGGKDLIVYGEAFFRTPDTTISLDNLCRFNYKNTVLSIKSLVKTTRKLKVEIIYEKDQGRVVSTATCYQNELENIISNADCDVISNIRIDAPDSISKIKIDTSFSNWLETIEIEPVYSDELARNIFDINMSSKKFKKHIEHKSLLRLKIDDKTSDKFYVIVHGL